MINYLVEAIVLSFIIGGMAGAMVAFHLQHGRLAPAKARNDNRRNPQ